MAYAHCHNCDWSQDDFWHGSYTPLHGDHFESTRRDLLAGIQQRPEDRYHIMDKWFAEEAGLPYEDTPEGARVHLRDVLAWELERRAQNIREMKWWTEEDYREDLANNRCPKCDSDQLGVD
jgi:hypothetical protein